MELPLQQLRGSSLCALPEFASQTDRHPVSARSESVLNHFNADGTHRTGSERLSHQALHLVSKVLALPYILRISLKAVDRLIDDLTGRKFGKWVVLPRENFESNYRNSKWLAQCECGRLRLVAGQDLLNGRSSSCGCAPRKNSDNGKTSVGGLALRTRLQRVMNELRPEGTGPSEAARESGLIDEDTQSDRRMIV